MLYQTVVRYSCDDPDEFAEVCDWVVAEFSDRLGDRFVEALGGPAEETHD